MKQGKQRMRKSVFALALAVVMIAGLCGISAAAAPVITEKDGTVTLSENGLSVVVSGVVSRESVRLNAFDDPVTVYHLAPGASVVMRNDSNEDDCIYSWYDGWSAEKGRVWSFSGAGYDRDVECPAGHSLTYTPTPVFSGEDGRLKVNKDLPETAAFVFEDIMWGGISVFFAQDNGRVSLANCTVDGVPFDSYFAGKGFETATAYASTQTVTIDGKAVELQAYALKDANGNATNYVKLRDVAYVLNGTAARFDVGWDGNVNIITGQSYTATGSEMFTPFSGDRLYAVPTAVTKVNGAAAELAAISLTDDNGGGYTYYQLRDLGKALGFNVGWSAASGIFIQTDKPYTDAD